MIAGFTGLGLNELVGAMQRSKYGQQAPPRTVQPMPKMDTVQFSARSLEISSAGASASQDTQNPVTPERPVATEKPAQPANEMSMMDRMKAAFFTKAGDDGFDSALDLNSDGRINHTDLAALRESESPADEMSMMDRMKAAFFTKAGDDGFDSALDLNSDGRINHTDLAALREPQSPPAPMEMLQQMQGSFLSRAGDDNFDTSLDLNTDGVVNFADLAMLRAKMETAITRPPAQPQPTTPIQPAATPAVELSPAAAQPRFDGPSDTAVTVDAIRSAMFSNAGDESFNAVADLNADGRINFADLAALKSE